MHLPLSLQYLSIDSCDDSRASAHARDVSKLEEGVIEERVDQVRQQKSDG